MNATGPISLSSIGKPFSNALLQSRIQIFANYYGELVVVQLEVRRDRDGEKGKRCGAERS